jgi:large subunit ribosomal protein L7A
MSYEKVEHATALFIGMKQTVKAIEQGLVKEVFIAKDADPKLTGKVKSLCEVKHVPCEVVDSMKRLGKACGIEVGAATAAIMITE